MPIAGLTLNLEERDVTNFMAKINLLKMLTGFVRIKDID